MREKRLLIVGTVGGGGVYARCVVLDIDKPPFSRLSVRVDDQLRGW